MNPVRNFDLSDRKYGISNGMKAFCCWSGGKESALSYYRVAKERKIEINCLLNMANKDGKHSRTHGISSALLQAQAKAMGIPLIQRKATWKGYEAEFKKAMAEFKNDGIEVGIFGDIDLQEHRDWVERVCKEIGIKPILPLWKEKRERLLEEFIGAGFKTIIVTTKAQMLNKDWLGRYIDQQFLTDLKKIKNVDLCGEAGEYHTFVFGGPIFKKAVNFITGKRYLRKSHCFLEISL